MFLKTVQSGGIPTDLVFGETYYQEATGASATFEKTCAKKPRYVFLSKYFDTGVTGFFIYDVEKNVCTRVLSNNLTPSPSTEIERVSDTRYLFKVGSSNLTKNVIVFVY